MAEVGLVLAVFPVLLQLADSGARASAEARLEFNPFREALATTLTAKWIRQCVLVRFLLNCTLVLPVLKLEVRIVSSIINWLAIVLLRLFDLSADDPIVTPHVLFLWVFTMIDTQFTWALFRGLYFILEDPATVRKEYAEALRARFEHERTQHQTQQSLVMFIDGMQGTEVPVESNTTDKDLMARLVAVYLLSKAEFSALSCVGITFKILGHLEISELLQVVTTTQTTTAPAEATSPSAGETAASAPLPPAPAVPSQVSQTSFISSGRGFSILPLGQLGRNANTYLFWNHEHLSGDAMVQELRRGGVLTDAATPKTHALNFVSTWNPTGAIIFAVGPVFLSVLFCVVWPAVAVTRFDADVQTSIQTGVTIGSYVITAGALLIAFIAFLDTLKTKS